MIELIKFGALWRIVLNRPEKANSLTSEMLKELISVVEKATQEPKVMVLTGAGTVFSAGADLNEAHAGLATSPLWEELSCAIAALPCLTIAALNGTLAGGAFGMVLACDIRVAVERSKFFYPVMKLGFLPQPSDPIRLKALVGPARAKMILLAGQKITAQEALAWGLVDRVTSQEGLADMVQELAADALGADMDHIAGCKEMLR